MGPVRRTISLICALYAERRNGKLTRWLSAVTGCLLCASVAYADDAKDWDFNCAIAAAVGVAETNDHQDSPEWWEQMSLLHFYLGRLSVRDSRTSWATVIKGRAAHTSVPQPMAKACSDFVAGFFELKEAR
jgi:hypothetical protein